jgi:hypothetical protein
MPFWKPQKSTRRMFVFYGIHQIGISGARFMHSGVMGTLTF